MRQTILTWPDRIWPDDHLIGEQVAARAHPDGENILRTDVEFRRKHETRRSTVEPA